MRGRGDRPPLLAARRPRAAGLRAEKSASSLTFLHSSLLSHELCRCQFVTKSLTESFRFLDDLECPLGPPSPRFAHVHSVPPTPRLRVVPLPDSLDFLVSSQCRLSVRPGERRHHVSGVPDREAGPGDLLLISPRHVRDVAVLDAILWRAFVAGPVNGAVVASWRKTSRNRFSSGVSSLILRSSLFRLSVRVGLQDLLRGPVGCVLGPGTGRRRITLQRSSRRDRLGCSPLSGLVRLPRNHGHTERCRPDLSSLKPDRLPTQGAVQCR